jgi:hypothetical protein
MNWLGGLLQIWQCRKGMTNRDGKDVAALAHICRNGRHHSLDSSAVGKADLVSLVAACSSLIQGGF